MAKDKCIQDIYGKMWKEIAHLEDLAREVKVNQSHYRPEVPRGFQEVKVPRFRDNGTGWW